jgi:hypothetical protein
MPGVVDLLADRFPGARLLVAVRVFERTDAASVSDGGRARLVHAADVRPERAG